VLGKNLEPFAVLLDFQAELGNKPDLLSDNLVELLVLVVGIWGEVLVQVVLRNRVNNVVCHLSVTSF
jgi:hypothetical protein